MKILDYMVVEDDNLDRMVSTVRHYIGSGGWEPLGNVRVASIITRDVQGPVVKYYQALVRRQQAYSPPAESLHTPVKE